VHGGGLMCPKALLKGAMRLASGCGRVLSASTCGSLMTIAGDALQRAADPVAAEEDGESYHPQAVPAVHAFPWRHTKVVHFVRHGEGYHNGAPLCRLEPDRRNRGAPQPGV